MPLVAHNQAILTIPLSAFRCLGSYPKEKKIICEINSAEIRRFNAPKTLDEIIAQARLDYALGNFKTFTNADALLAELKSEV